jgi:hypothetical protein
MMLLKTDQEVRDFAGMVSVLSIVLKCIFVFLLALLLHRTAASLGQNAANICSCFSLLRWLARHWVTLSLCVNLFHSVRSFDLEFNCDIITGRADGQILKHYSTS